VLTAMARAQNGFTALAPAEPLDFSQINDSYAHVSGHWIPVDAGDKRDALTGPSTSEISCSRSNKTCADTNANIIVTGNTFALNASHDEYTIERWNETEIVASNVGGTCRVRNVIKFDRVQKRVYWMQALAEPVDGLPKGLKDFCKLVGMNLELKNSTLWIK